MSDKIYELLKRLIEAHQDSQQRANGSMIFLEAAQEIERLQSQLQASEWTKVEEKPKEDGLYIVCIKGEAGTFINTKIFRDGYWQTSFHISHYKPELLTPPTE